MDARLDVYNRAVAGKFAKHIDSAGAVITGSTLLRNIPPSTQGTMPPS